jgi:hypothetical protein
MPYLCRQRTLLRLNTTDCHYSIRCNCRDIPVNGLVTAMGATAFRIRNIRRPFPIIVIGIILKPLPKRQAGWAEHPAQFPVGTTATCRSFSGRRIQGSAHLGTFDLRWEHTPRTVIVAEEKNRQQAGRPQCLDANIASLIRG